LLAIKGLVTFLVKNSYLSHNSLSHALNDFLEQYQEELIFLSSQDYKEVSKIKQDPSLLTNSYLFKRIEPFLLPYYEKSKQSNSTSL
jgi:hypothetical protein